MQKELCFKEADILLPDTQSTNMTKWSVIACDQYTSDMNYWKSVGEIAGAELSALNIIFPEIYLETESGEKKSERIKNINAAMQEYNKKLKCFENSMFYIERELKNGSIRHGFVGVADLEEYDYHKNAKAKIRATEETVIERLPPRIKIRQTAVLESPHIMLLYNEENNTTADKIKSNINNLEKVYDFELMKNSGHIKAYRLDSECKNYLMNALSELEAKSSNGLLFAVGDGNHSLAAAKECYEEIKKQCGTKSLNHPARYALVEIVNIYDESLHFEPIYRTLFNVNPLGVIAEMKKEYDISFDNPVSETYHKFEVYYKNQMQKIYVNNPNYYLPVKVLQVFLDKYLKNNASSEPRIDYIHGREEAIAIAQGDNNMSFIFDTMKKGDLFTTIERDGVLPRKTFSMGETYDKRFYVECRKISY